MSVNRHKPHILVLPEDDANRQLANGFSLEIGSRQLQILGEAGGWRHVCETFCLDHVPEMRKYNDRLMVLLVDFDNNLDRARKIKADIPAELADRVFVIGVLSEPEELRRQKGIAFEAIGRIMARDCRDGQTSIWEHPLLAHNQGEVARLHGAVSVWLLNDRQGQP